MRDTRLLALVAIKQFKALLIIPIRKMVLILFRFSMHFKRKQSQCVAFERGCDGSVLQSLKCVLTETCRFKSNVRILISFPFTVIVFVVVMI